MTLKRRSISIALVLLSAAFIARAQQTTPPASTTPPPSKPEVNEMTVTAVDVPTKCKQPLDPSGYNEQANDKLCEAGIGDQIIVEVKNLSENISKPVNPVNPGDLVLFLGGRPLNGVSARLVDNRLEFELKRTEGSNQAWSALLAKPSLHPLRPETVSVGYEDKQALPFTDAKHPPRINLRVYHPYWAAFSLIGLLLTLGLFVWLAKNTGVIRDTNPPQVPTTTRPYSLSRTQAAFWFFLVIGSFIFLYLITGDYNTITNQALILMGIGTGTALGAAMIDASKTDTANDQLSQLNPKQAQLRAELVPFDAKVTELTGSATADTATDADKQALAAATAQRDAKKAELDEVVKKIDDASSGLSKPTSDGFGRDLLTDVNGINFHRFQMLVWTIVLGILFCVGVYANLAMPDFSATLLALMGISAGTYLGFKIPEQQN
jgi:hypothetical protein